MARTLSGSGTGMLVVLVGFLVLMFISTSSLGQPSSSGIFGLILVTFFALFVFLFLGRRGRAGLRW